MLAASVLAFYSLGATAMEGLVNYPTWRIIAPSAFRAYHRAVDPRVIAVLVIPYAALTVATALLVPFGPPPLPRPFLWACLALQGVAWAATLSVQVPIQRRLSREGWDGAALDRLIRSDRWFRQVPNALNAAIFALLLGRLLSEGAA